MSQTLRLLLPSLFVLSCPILASAQESQTLAPAALPSATPAEVGMSAEELSRVIPALQQFVDDKKVSGAIVAVARHGKVVLMDAVGYQDIDSKDPMKTDSILRFYSMTKAITSVAIMTLVEDGELALDDPVSTHVPEFSNLRVFSEQDESESKADGEDRVMTIRDLLRHTSGLTYGFFGNTPVDQAYRQAGILSGGDSLQDTIDKLAQQRLLYQPGTTFNYSVSTDVLGHIVERVSGKGLDEYFEERILQPLQMSDTAFFVAPENISRFATNYGPGQGDKPLRVIDSAEDSQFSRRPPLLSGGGGLTSTAGDYLQFCQMLLNEGELNGVRILQADTVRQMTRNQLPDAAIPIAIGAPRDGVGFGLGFSVVMEITDWTQNCHVGEYGWGGAASTHFWISPKDDLAVVVLTQFMPFSFQLEDAVKPLVYDAILD